jgi:leucyl/phenylalanyl-tRNA--protein transferase
MHWQFGLIDCQVATRHLKTFGAHDIPRTEFMTLLKRSLAEKTRRGKWTFTAHRTTSKRSFKKDKY